MLRLTRFLLFFLTLISGNLLAANLCDSSCNLSVTFPDGGALRAIEPITITFGNGAVINDGIVSTGYSAGDSLALSSGQSIDFQANGSFDLGEGGNLDYSDIMIESNGVMELSATGGSETIFIQDFTLLGNISLTITSNFEVNESGLFHIFNGSVTIASNFTFTNHGSVSGFFQLTNTSLTLDTETYDISGPILIEVDGEAKIIAKEATSEPVTVTINNKTTTGTSSSGASEATSASGGIINLFSLSVLLLVLALNRNFRVIYIRNHQ